MRNLLFFLAFLDGQRKRISVRTHLCCKYLNHRIAKSLCKPKKNKMPLYRDSVITLKIIYNLRSESLIRILKDKCSFTSIKIRYIFIKCVCPTPLIPFVKHALATIALGRCAHCCFRALAVLFPPWIILSPYLLISLYTVGPFLLSTSIFNITFLFSTTKLFS